MSEFKEGDLVGGQPWTRPEGPHADAVRECIAWLISVGERGLAERLDWHMGVTR